MSAFGATAAFIAAIGIYGVLAYAMTQRTQEFGVRLALNADPRSILTLAIRQGVVLVVVGLCCGVAGAVAVTRYLQGLLFGLTALDVRTYLIVVGLFGAVALMACYAPARRATSISPLEAVKFE